MMFSNDLGRASDDIISDSATGELLLRDDEQFVSLWWSWFVMSAHVPAGSSVEGAFLARNAKDHREVEEEEDKMCVVGWCRLDGGSPLVSVGDEHVHVSYPHDNVHIIAEWEDIVPVNDTYINGRHLMREYENLDEQCLGIRDIQGPSVATTLKSFQLYGEKTSKLDCYISDTETSLTRYRELISCQGYVEDVWMTIYALLLSLPENNYMLPEEMTEKSDDLDHYLIEMSTWRNYVEEFYQLSLDFQQWMENNLVACENYHVEQFTLELLTHLSNCVADVKRLLSSCDVSPASLTKQFGLQMTHSNADLPYKLQDIIDAVGVLFVHIERGIEIIAMYRSHLTDPFESADNVPVIEGSFWPQQAQNFEHRLRKWPSKQIIEQVVNNGFHLVSKPRPNLSKSVTDYDWRVSFALSEQILARSRTYKQRKAYYIFKMFYYKYLKCIEVNGHSLRSYACKAVMLWVCEENDVSWWEDNSTLKTVKYLLTYLLRSLRSRYLPYYFIDNVNLFDAWGTPGDVIKRCISTLTCMLNEPETYLVRNVDILVQRILGDRTKQSKVFDQQELERHRDNLRECLRDMLSVYVGIAEHVILKQPLPDNISVELSMEISTEWSSQVQTQLDESLELQSYVDEQFSLYQTFTGLACIVKFAGAGTDLKCTCQDVLKKYWGGTSSVFEHVTKFIWCLTSYRWSERVCEISQCIRTVISLVLSPPQVLDARVICNRDSREYNRCLSNRQIVAHFSTMIGVIKQALQLIDKI